VHLTDPEGTDLRFTLWDDYFDRGRPGFDDTPFWGHIMGHPPTPLLPREDATGVACGTTSHFARPFPRLEIEIQDGRVERISGGGAYGAAWNDLWKESEAIEYPCFPRPGLFWLWEVAIGTNPRIGRPPNISRLSSGGFEWERRRSGVIHLGFGTFWRGPEEEWAAERKLVYGHLHIHLLFPTYRIETPQGKTISVIEHGHLTALDDPEVRALAARYGDPDKVLSADWVPAIPGISGPGDYAEYARDPAPWIYEAAPV
jgi:hypothetical protein